MKLSIQETSRTPAIVCDAASGLIDIKGRSTPENSTEFYKPFFEWLDEYAKNPHENTLINICLDYFNTGSSHSLLTLFGTMQTIHNKGYNVTVCWYCDDEDIRDYGLDFQIYYKFNFKVILVEDNSKK